MSVIYINSYQFASAAAPWTPAEITTALWLDAADASTITESGGAVSQWDDKSGNTRHAAQSTPAAMPAYVTNALNNKSIVSFDGSDDYLISSLSKSAFTQNQLSIFLVYVPTNTNISKGIYQLASVINSGGPWILLQQENATTHRCYVDGSYRVNYAVSTNTPLLHSLQYDGSQWGVYKDGASVGTYTGSFGIFSANNLYLGNGYNGFSGCRIGEVVALSTAPTTLNRQKLEGYLAHKWGLTANLPAGHPYKLTGPTA